MSQIPNGTDVCYYGYIQAKIGGYNGVDHLIVEREDGGPDVWSSNFVVGFCIIPPNEDPTIFDMIADNKEIIVVGAIVGAIVILR